MHIDLDTHTPTSTYMCPRAAAWSGSCDHGKCGARGDLPRCGFHELDELSQLERTAPRTWQLDLDTPAGESGQTAAEGNDISKVATSL